MPKKKSKIRRIYVKAKKKWRRKDKRVPLLPMAGLAVTLMKPAELALAGDYEGALAETGARFTGYNFQSGVFDLWYAVLNGYAPVVAGAIASKVMTRLGVNRMMKKIPFAGKYIKL